MASIWLRVPDPQGKLSLPVKAQIKSKLEGKTLTVRLDDPDLSSDDKIVDKKKLEPLIREGLLKAAPELGQAPKLELNNVDSVAALGKVGVTVDTYPLRPYRCTIEVAGPVSSDPDKRMMKRGTPPKPPPMGPKKSLVKPAAKPAASAPPPKTAFVKSYQDILKKYANVISPKPSVIASLTKLDGNRDGAKTEALCDAAVKALKDARTKDTELVKKEADKDEKLKMSQCLFDIGKLAQKLEDFKKQND